jgi:hypothetical protein
MFEQYVANQLYVLRKAQTAIHLQQSFYSSLCRLQRFSGTIAAVGQLVCCCCLQHYCMKLLCSAILHLNIIYSILDDCFDDAQNKQQTDACLLQPERVTHPSVLITTNTACLIHSINCLRTTFEIVLRELFRKPAALLHI